MRLPRQVLEFRDAGVVVVVGVVNCTNRLELNRVREMLMLETQAPIRKPAEAVVKESIDGASVDSVIDLQVVPQSKVVGA